MFFPRNYGRSSETEVIPGYARIAILAGALAALAASGPARAVDLVDARATDHDGYARLELIWPEALADARLEADVEIRHGVMIARLARPIDADLSGLAEALGGRAALARLDPDGTSLRLALRRPARAHVSRSGNVLAIDLVDQGRPDPPDIVSQYEITAREQAERARLAAEAAARPPVRLPLAVQVAEASDYARIAFDFTERVDYEIEDGRDRATIRFGVDAAPDLARLRVDPPAGVAGAEADHAGDQLSIRLDLRPGFVTRSWRDGDRIVVDVVPADAVAEIPLIGSFDEALEDEAAGAPRRADAGSSRGRETEAPARGPVMLAANDEEEAAEDTGAEHAGAPEAAAEDEAEPEDEVVAPRVMHRETTPVRAAVTPSGRDVLVAFAWSREVGAAVFRRGDVWWIVFDAEAELDLGELRRAGGRQVRFVEPISASGYSGLRIGARPETQIAADADGASWVFSLGEAAPAPPTPSAITRREDDADGVRLFARLDGVSAVFEVADPEVGDRLVVAAARPPVQGLLGRRVFAELVALPSAHGLAFELGADGLEARRTRTGVEIARDGGLTLSAATAAEAFAAERRSAAPLGDTAGLIDFAGWGGRAEDFVERSDALSRAAAVADDRGEALLSLARFYMGHELAEETLGVVGVMLHEEPFLLNDPRVRALRGAAYVLAERYALAAQDLAAPALANDASAALWRGYLAARTQQWREARREFESGRDALSLVRSDWRARFLVSAAEAALNLNDLAAAEELVQAALAEDPPGEIRLAARLLGAHRRLALGDEPGALAAARSVATSGVEPIEARALHLALQLEQDLGQITPEEAIEALELLRLRWRGDAVELEIARILGRSYVNAGDYRRGITMMRAATARFPDNPVARAMGHETSDIFAGLFLGDDADRLDPVQALALWYEFSELTPIGPEGDRMIRRLSDRLVEFDLLPQAAELLQHQVDNRLRGVARAYVATDLAAVYLMDRRTEEALNTIRTSRHARLPQPLNQERRLLEARALSELGRHEHALEILDTDRTQEARALRAEISWSMRDWPRAGAAIEAALGESWRETAALSADGERAVLRAAIAYSLAGDDASVARLDARYGRRMSAGAEANSWRVVTGRETDANGARLSELIRRIAEIDTLDAFVAEFRARRAAADEEGAASETAGGAE